MTDGLFDRLSNIKNIRHEFLNKACAIIPTSSFVQLMELKQKKNAIKKSNIPKLFHLRESFKNSCDPELYLEMLNEMFIDSTTDSNEQIQNFYKITENKIIIKNHIVSTGVTSEKRY